MSEPGNVFTFILRTWAFDWGIEHQNEFNIWIFVKRIYREIMYIIILVITEQPIPMILVVAAEISQFYATATINLLDHLVSIATVHIPPLTPERWCEHPSVFLVFAIKAQLLTLWWERDRHIWVCGPLTGLFGLRDSAWRNICQSTAVCWSLSYF